MKNIMTTIKKGIASIVTAAVVFGIGLGVTRDNALAYNAGIEAFVNSLYSDCLGRSADPTGFNDWCNKLATGQITGKQAAYGFFFSPEFIAKANAWTDDQLIEAYYRVFLNRGSDPSGASYWAQQIAGTTNDISILFTGFADSTEFASKCASYGITVGPHVNVPTTVRGTSSGSTGGANIVNSSGFTSWAISYATNGKANDLNGYIEYISHTTNPDHPSYPYVYGGTSTTNGIDCSGLNCYIANQYFGVTNMPHNMYQQAANYGTTIDPSQIQPGDIICDYGYSHGDIYFYVGRVSTEHRGTVYNLDYFLCGSLSEDGRSYSPMITSFNYMGYGPITSIDEFIAGDPAHRRIARIG